MDLMDLASLESQYSSNTQTYDFLFELFCSVNSHPKLSFISEQISIEPNPEKLRELIVRNSRKKPENSLKNYDIEYARVLDYVINGNYFRIRQLSLPGIVFDNKMLQIYTFDYTADQEEKFKNPIWLYHGSSLHSWFFIIKNGLKVLSRTALQAHGAVYGPGIYMSNSFQVSAGYCSYTTSSKQRVIGVFQLDTDPSKFKKTPNIFVVPNESHLLLRFLIVVNENLTDLSFVDGLVGEIINKIGFSQSKVSNVITNKRLGIELAQLKSNEKVLTINVIVQDKEWVVLLTNGSELQILFSKYPINPPLIKLNGQAQKLDILNPSKWSITTRLNDLIELFAN